MKTISVLNPLLAISDIYPSFCVYSGKKVEDMTDIERDFFYLKICQRAAVDLPNAKRIYLHYDSIVENKNRYGKYQEHQYTIVWQGETSVDVFENQASINSEAPCNQCQGCGCAMCEGFGLLIN